MAKKTTSSSEFFAKYKDPRWQKKRLEIMERDGFACVKCRDNESTLNVHHVCYRRNTDPWAYPGFLLVTLCEHCHSHCGPVNEEVLGLFSDVANSIAFQFTQEFPKDDELTTANVLRILMAIFQDDAKWTEIKTWYDGLPFAKQLNQIEGGAE